MMPPHLVAIVAALTLAGSGAAGADAMKFQELTLPSRDLPEPPPSPIRHAPTPPGAAPAATPGAGEVAVRRRYLDAGRTSRSAATLPPGALRVARRTELPANLRPLALLATATRVVVQARDRFLLCSRDGDPLATGLLGSGELLLAPEEGLLLLPDTIGHIAARSLSDGKPAFLIGATFGDTHGKDFLSLSGRRLIHASHKIVTPVENPALAAPPPEVLLQSQLLAKGMETRSGYARRESDRTLLRRARKLLLAIGGGSVVAATENRIYHLSAGLDVRSVIEGSFDPLALSLDEARRLYLVVHAEGKNWLWVMTLEGERLLAQELPPPRPGGYPPPMIGYHHSIFLPVEHRIFVLNPRGEHRADYAVSDAFAGAVVLPGDDLLLSDGPDLVRVSLEGESTKVASFEGDTLRTAPALLGDGQVWVASERHLYRLEPASASAPAPSPAAR